MAAITSSQDAGGESERILERLARAGLLVAPGVPRARPDPDALAQARAAAAKETSAAELISTDRG
jgi:hypothetical protein